MGTGTAALNRKNAPVELCPSVPFMSVAKKELLLNIVGDFEGYLDCLKESGVTEVVSYSGSSNPLGAMEPVYPTNTTNAADGLRKIAEAVKSCVKCPLQATRTNTVPGQGNLHPDILFIGEGPGEEEDRQGLAFVGRAGQLLTRLITRMGYKREEVFIANIVKCRPPGNRKPLPDEVSACLPYLEAQIALLEPKVIVLLGASALEGLIKSDVKISRARGHWIEYHPTSRSAVAAKAIPTMPTFHPSYLLRNQSAMWDVWNDMLAVLKRLGREPQPQPNKSKD